MMDDDRRQPIAIGHRRQPIAIGHLSDSGDLKSFSVSNGISSAKLH